MDGPEGNARDIIRIKPGLERVGVDPFGREAAERERVADADVHEAQLAQDPRGRVPLRALGIRDVGRREHPRKTGIGESHVTGPSLHGNDRKLAGPVREIALLAAVQALLVDQCRQLPYRQSIDIRDVELADEGIVPVLDGAALDLEPAERVGAVENDDLDALLSAGAHQQAEGTDEGI